MQSITNKTSWLTIVGLIIQNAATLAAVLKVILILGLLIGALYFVVVILDRGSLRGKAGPLELEYEPKDDTARNSQHSKGTKTRRKPNKKIHAKTVRKVQKSPKAKKAKQ